MLLKSKYERQLKECNEALKQKHLMNKTEISYWNKLRKEAKNKLEKL